jgi:long-chain fatty acid transport protein
MSIKPGNLLRGLVAAGCLALPPTSFATNGYFMIGFGTGSVGMGGVGVTSPQDTMCVGGNPACLTEFEGPRFVMSGDGQMTWSGVNTYVLPGMGFVFPFNDQLTFGFAALGNGGAGTTYNPNFFGGGKEYLGVDMVQLIIPITVTYKFNKTNTFGVSVIPARQRFMAQGLENFAIPAFSSDPQHVTGKGHDFANGLGVRIGWAAHYMDNMLTLGATYASKIYMGKFHLYQGLFADGGSFDIPANFAFGVGVKPIENLTVALDVQKILYSDIPAVGGRGPDPTGNLPNAANGTLLGLPGSSGFGWKDQTVYKLGVAYKNAFPSFFGEDRLTLRAGYNYGKTPIQQDQLLFNLLAPATSEQHYTVGLTYSMGEQSIFGFGSEGLFSAAYIHSPTKKMEGPVVGTGGEHGLAAFEMKQNILDFSYTLKF